jgi:hypothetical protein
MRFSPVGSNLTPVPSCLTTRQASVWFFAFLAAALLPRMSLILAGASYADDWGHGYSAHLESYRPVAALELWTMQSVFGPDYLTLKPPKFVASFWYAMSLTVLMRVARRFAVPAPLFGALGVAALLHPIMNELILWGVLSTLAFVTFLSILGAALVFRGGGSGWRAAGVVLLCLGAAGSQLGVTIGACLVVAELASLGWRNLVGLGRQELLWRFAVVMLPPVVAVAVLLGMRFGLGYVDFGSRSIGLSSPTLAGWLQDKFYVYSNAIANLYQAPMGVVFGHDWALRAFWPVVLLSGPLLFILLILAKVPRTKALLSVLAVPAMLGIALSPLLGANAMPTGYRILGGALLMLVVAVSLPLSLVWDKPMARRFTIGAVAALALSFAWSSLVDVRVREAAWQRDLAWLEEARSELSRSGLAKVQLCAWSFSPPAGADADKSGIIVSYNHARPHTYSVWYTQFLAAFLGVKALKATAPDMYGYLPYCTSRCTEGSSGRFGPFALKYDQANSTAYVCD